MNFEADKTAQPVQYISHDIRLMLMAAVTGNSIGVWEWQEPQCMPLILYFQRVFRLRFTRESLEERTDLLRTQYSSNIQG